MTTTVTVQVPQDASYRAKVTAITGTMPTEHDQYVEPGASRTFHAYDGCTLRVAEERIPASQLLRPQNTASAPAEPAVA